MARPSPSTIRVVRVLTLLGDDPDQPLNLSEISRRLDLNRATVHSMLAILTQSGYLVREPTTKAFRLGPALIPIAAAGLRPLRDVFVAIHAELEDLSEQVDARCVVMTPISGRIVIVDAVGRAFPPVAQVGRGAVFAAPYAIALVAWAAEDEVARWLSAETLTDQERETYRERMRVVRDRGFSVATPGTRKELEKAAEELLAQAESPEVERALHQLMVEIARESNELLEIVTDRTYRLRAIAAPVFDAEGGTIAAVSLTGLPELTGRQVRDYGYTLSIAMDRVTKRIGGRAPDARDRLTPCRGPLPSPTASSPPWNCSPSIRASTSACRRSRAAPGSTRPRRTACSWSWPMRTSSCATPSTRASRSARPPSRSV